MKAYLCVIDATGIQQYIFGSNRLKENLGAAYLVAQATEDWVDQALPDPHNLKADGSLDETKHLADGKLDAELLYRGGGNALVLFKDHCEAREFAGRVSLTAFQRAPGLDLAIYSDEVEFDQLADEVGQVMADMARWKAGRPRSQPLLALPVVATCDSTRGPAVMEETFRGLRVARSAETVAKLKNADAAQNKLKNELEPENWGFAWAEEFDQLGRSHGESSYLAVVHADGNGIGKRFSELGERGLEPRAYIGEARALSDAVRKLGLEALKETVAHLTRWLAGPDGKQFAEDLATVEKDHEAHRRDQQPCGRRYFPLRPLVYGGDDVTFVCEGRLGLSLAVDYLERFEQKSASLPGGGAASCAGITLVKTHYPFARAYGLAEELLGEAKRLSREREEEREQPTSCLDWHIAGTGLAGKLGEIRRREYLVKDGQLNLRPVTLGDDDIYQAARWEVFEAMVRVFQTSEAWAGRQNKLLGLRDALRLGQGAVEQFRARFAVPELPSTGLEQRTGPTETGWLDAVCTHFDAVEALEFCTWLDLARAEPAVVGQPVAVEGE